MKAEMCPCGGARWVCARHPTKAWPTECECSEGVTCECNPNGVMGDDFVVVAGDPGTERELN